MCLLTYQANPKVAKYDIRCWKVMSKRLDCYTTPYCFVHVPYDVLEGMKQFDSDSEPKLECVRDGIFAVDRGLIHTYADRKTAFQEMETINNLFSYGTIFECVVPAGVEYYVSCDKSEYGSRSIRFVREVI